MHFIHLSELKIHGNLKSSNCVVDSRFVLKVTDYSLRELRGNNEDIEDYYAYWKRKFNNLFIWKKKSEIIAQILLCIALNYSSNIPLEEIYFQENYGLHQSFLEQNMLLEAQRKMVILTQIGNQHL